MSCGDTTNEYAHHFPPYHIFGKRLGLSSKAFIVISMLNARLSKNFKLFYNATKWHFVFARIYRTAMRYIVLPVAISHA